MYNKTYDYRRLKNTCHPYVAEKCGVVFDTVRLDETLGTSEPGQPYAPKFGDYTNAIVQYLADGRVFIYDSEGYFTNISNQVLSVNDKTGTITLKISDLENDLEYQTKTEVETAIEEAIASLQTTIADLSSQVATLTETVNTLTNTEQGE